MKFTLKKANLSKVGKDIFSKAFAAKNKDEVFGFIKKYVGFDYLYWDSIQYQEPSPKGFAKEELWSMIKAFREAQSIKTAIRMDKGKFFTWSKLDYFEEFFHDLDMNTGGEIFVDKDGVNKANKQKIITRGIMDEAIASSQLEGAATSRQAAKKMLREGRKPANKSEQMIVNSYVSMKAIEDNYKDKKMSMALILELHGLITKDTLDSENEKPRLRKGSEPIYITDKSDGIIYHTAPAMNFVNKELERLIRFANDDLENISFIHPIIKAIMLHFWMGFLHPFTDGNGRLARLLFYWYLIKNGYWAFVYLPISKAIKLAPKQYIMAYVYSEQDDNDLTYFIDYNIKKIKLAVKEFEGYLASQSKGNTQMKKNCESKYRFNMRQIQLLQYLHGDSDERTSLKTHMNINQIAKMTAFKDLKDLKRKGFLTQKKLGKIVYYYGTEKIKELF